ncbi:hypothetical protein HYPSUDRAFT_207286 [Hypholoma sublateritium FD-334 SS-4]|uniref:Uncharacterized protein n=1 Tax=Hypholoma sublateritium (strain FD-334 SS-4) TaxID=945553 RepID=A0A0D2NAH7_HYPSF|nr:hypothetical protein HYPSUDRAFT_207286 [Hypholoma sublateritium FD-334 SS-4]
MPRRCPLLGAPAPTAVTTATQKKIRSLLSRYHLQERAKMAENVREEQLGGKAVWEDSAEKLMLAQQDSENYIRAKAIM